MEENMRKSCLNQKLGKELCKDRDEGRSYGMVTLSQEECIKEHTAETEHEIYLYLHKLFLRS